jgi:hypothetical protein
MVSTLDRSADDDDDDAADPSPATCAHRHECGNFQNAKALEMVELKV